MSSYPISSRVIENLRVGNGAGMIRLAAEVARACESGLTHITIGTITYAAREGNIGDTDGYDPETECSVNARGMPNRGWLWYQEQLPEMCRAIHQSGKKARVSIAGSSPEEIGVLAQRVCGTGVDEIEINGGCPNEVNADGLHKPILSYDPSAVSAVLSEVKYAIGTSMPVAFKTSPVPDDILPGLVGAIAESGIVSSVVGVNTLPGQRMLINGKSALRFRAADARDDSPWLDTGGGAGAMLRSDSLRVVRYLRAHLPAEISIIAVGGIMSGADVVNALEAGACGFQCATAYLEGDGPHAINRILEEFGALIEMS